MYLFADLGSNGIDLDAIANDLRASMADLGIRGTLILAPEGINGTIAGSDRAIQDLIDFLRMDVRLLGRLAGLTPAISMCSKQPFARARVKVRPEIVTLREPDADPTKRVGVYVEPHEWNAVVDNPDVLLIDTRNDFEVRLGTFVASDGSRAMNPKIPSFGDFPRFVERALGSARHRPIALFCTGGIRCERASSYLLGKGFGDVRHLRGGILGYLDLIAPDDSRWSGSCFVFDDRVALGHGLRPIGPSMSGTEQP